METRMGNEFTADIKVINGKALITIHSHFRNTDKMLYDLRDLLLKKGISAEIDNQGEQWKALNFEI